jgi:hypothetical protein
MSHLRRSLSVLVLYLGLGSCGGDPSGPEPPEPPGPPTPIAVGDTVPVELSSTQLTQTFSFHTSASEPESIALFGQGLDGFLILTVTDSAQDLDVGGMSVDGTSERPLLATFTRVEVAARTTYLIRVRGATPGVGRGRFFLYRVSRAPESRSSGISIDAVEEGEALETAADVDEFDLSGHTGDELIGYFQALDAQPANGLVFAVFDESVPLGAGGNGEDSAELQSQATGRFLLPHDGSYRVLVRAEFGWTLPGRADAGRYRFQIRRIVRAPEQLAAPVQPGDTVDGEALDYVGDVDEFVFTGVAGELYNVFLETLDPSPAQVRALTVLGPDGSSLIGVGAEGGGSSLFARATGRFPLPVTGSYSIRVEGFVNITGIPRGPYRLYLYRIDSLPETAPASLVLGQSVANEAIELPGDLDVFTMAVPTASTGNLILWNQAPNPTPPFMTVLGPDDDQLAIVFTPAESPGPGEVGGASGATQFAAVNHRLRVEAGSGDRDGSSASYRIETVVFAPGPEDAPASITIGTVVSGESLDPAGDFDVYQFTGARGQLVEMVLQGTAGPEASGQFEAILSPTGPFPLGVAGTDATAPPPGQSTLRINLPEDGDYTIRVSPSHEGRVVGERGSYRLSLLPVNPALEHLPAVQPLAATISGEAIDAPGDIDRFTFTGSPGTEYELFTQASTQASGPAFGLAVEVLGATGDAPLRIRPVVNVPLAIGRLAIPSSGQLRLQVFEQRIGLFLPAYVITGPYTLSAVPIDRRPETRVPAVGRNAVVQGEGIETIGDVDEFTFSGSAGETIQVYFNTPFGFFPGATLELVDPATDDVLGTVASGNPAPQLTDQGTGPVTLPHGGQYVVRVLGTSDFEGTGGYEFLIAD